MRTYDIPYVQNPGTPKPQPKLEDLDLKTIIKNYLCWKSQGRLSECRKCTPKCEYGKRALELAFPTDPMAFGGPKLIGNKTLLELAREENAKRKEEQTKAVENKQVETTPKKESKKKQRIFIDDWYSKAYESENPLKWIMEAYGISEHKAKQKVYEYQYRHPGLREEKPMWKSKKASGEAEETAKPAEAEPKEEMKQTENSEGKNSDDALLGPLENKINVLMNQQAEYKSKMEELKKEYEEKIAPYQKLYDETKVKVDALYEALNILSE